MITPHLLPRPKSYTDAHNEFLRTMGDPRTLNKYLTIALIVTSTVALALVAVNYQTAARQREKIVVRIDDLGRAQALGTTAVNYTVQPNEVKYFLSLFVNNYYGRNRETVTKDFERSLYFLNAPMAQTVMSQERQNKTLSKFVLSNEDEVTILVKNIVLDNLSNSPYTAQVDLEKIYNDRGGHETRRERFTDIISFTTSTEVPNSAILVNPLGFTILSLREDQAF